MKETLTERVREAIRTEHAKPGTEGCIPSESRLAKLYGVSIITVRRAVEELVQEGLLVKRQGKGTFVANGMAATPRSLGIALPDSSTYTYSKLCMLMEPMLRRQGHQVRLFVEKDAAEIAKAIESEKPRLEGLAICGYALNHRKLRPLGIPFVFAGAEDCWDADSVVFDLKSGVWKAVNHLIELGHRRIAFISHFAKEDSAAKRINAEFQFSKSHRFAGYCDALSDAGIELDEKLVLFPGSSKAETCEGLRRFMLEGGDKLFTAVFASTDIQAEGAAEAIRSLGRKIPEDYSVAGCDNVLGETGSLTSLTTLDLRLEEVAARAAEMLLERIGKPRVDESRCCGLVPSLVARESSGKAPCARES